MAKLFAKITILFGLSLFLLSSCEDCETCSDNDLTSLEINEKIAEAYVHSYAISIGAAMDAITGDSARISYIRNAIDPISFYEDSSGYFYVYDYDCVNIAHARPKDLLDQNLYDYQDSRGNYVIRLLSDKAQEGGGYVEYWWIKPGETGEKLKIGYVEPIPNTNYFIGSGVYTE